MPGKLRGSKSKSFPVKDIRPVLQGLASKGEVVFLDGGLGSQWMAGRVSSVGHKLSLLAAFPFMTFRVFGNKIEITKQDGSDAAVIHGDPLVELDRLFNCSFPPDNYLVAGYFGYELNSCIEDIKPQTGSETPDICLGFYDTYALIDRSGSMGTIYSHGMSSLTEPPSETLAKDRLKMFHDAITGKQSHSVSDVIIEGLQPNMEEARYINMVERCLDYIKAGDIYQANLSMEFSGKLTGGDGLDAYARLTERYPACMSAYINAGDFSVLSLSPEIFLEAYGDCVLTRPIKGTRPRGKNRTEDSRLIMNLLSSEKDRAELTMIVDVLRNDLGRVSVPGSVIVDELASLKTLPNVHHLEASIRGTMKQNMGCVELLRATFPGGSITGAPKIRAMEIIREFEPHTRGVYTGAIGVIGPGRSASLNVAIRTGIVKDGRITFHAGGGIVADSAPKMELEEVYQKAKPFLELGRRSNKLKAS